MKRKLFFWIIIIWAMPKSAYAQDEIVFDGADLNFQTLEDYENYEEKILVLVNWLKTHSLNHEDWEKGELVFLKWIGETPSLCIFYEEYIFSYTRKNPRLFVLFLAGWTEYVLRNPKEEEAVLKTNLAGINVILQYYLKGEEFGIIHDKNMEWLINKQAMGKLEKYIKRQIISRN